MAQDLKDRLAAAEAYDEMAELQEVAEEMFTRFCGARCEAAGQEAKNVVLLQELQRLEEDNGKLRRELVETEERYWNARGEADKLRKELDFAYEQLGKVADERTELSNEKTKLETQIRQMVAKAAKNGDPSGVREDTTSPCAGEALAPVACPRCGSMDVRMDGMGEGMRWCEVCGKTFGVN